MDVFAVKISGLPSYVGSKIKGDDIFPIDLYDSNAQAYYTQYATVDQAKNYIVDSISDQQLFTTDDVVFKSLSSSNITSDSITTTASYTTAVHANTAYISTLSSTALTATNATFTTVSSTTVSAVSANFHLNSVFFGSYSAAAKYSAIINHTGAPGEVFYTISHPFITTDIVVQVYEVAGSGVHEPVEKVITGIINRVDNNIGYSDIYLLNTNNATYKVIVVG